MRHGVLTAAALLFLTLPAAAQPLSGKVFGHSGDEREILPGAVLRFAGSQNAELSNENGVFKLDRDPAADSRLIVSFTGYQTDTIDISGKSYLTIVLEKDATALSGVTVSQNRAGFLSSTAVGQTAVITRHELSKSACCDLAGCFGAQAAVQAQTTNVVTNAQELRMLGLSGVYNQLLIDGLPLLQGAAYTYGVSAWPGVLIDNINISKGTTSVLQGYQGITGQINMVTSLPPDEPSLLLNAYVNSYGEQQYNVIGASPVGKSKKWRSLLSLHSALPGQRIDHNDDGFLDKPLLRRYAIFNKWTYRQEATGGFQLQAAVSYTDEQRIGGQNNYQPKNDKGSGMIYGQTMDYQQPMAYVKTSYRFSKAHSLNFNISAFGHRQQSWLGQTKYEADQKSLSAVLQHDWLWQESQELKWGLSYSFQDLKENISFSGNPAGKTYAGTYETDLRVPGLFAENKSMWLDDKLMLLAGIRVDRHQTEGLFMTPRVFVKWDFAKGHTLRASAGSGWRQVNLFSEQALLLATSRDLVFVETLKPEEAVTTGLSYVYRPPAEKADGYVSLDVYHTSFQNQFSPDYDQAADKIYIYNYKGKSRSLGAQAEAAVTFFRRLEVRAAYNFLDVYRIKNGVKEELPFTARHRAMAALSWQTKNKRWQADANVHWTGRMKLPDTRLFPDAFQRPAFSDPFAVLGAQLRHRWKTLECYIGVENLTGFTQHDPIISASNPFGPYFDLSSVWGPTSGREIYLGVTLNLN